MFHKAKYLLFDGTYFHQDGCLAILMDSQCKRLLGFNYIKRESYHNIRPILLEKRQQGLNPKAITIDGHMTVIRAIRDVWPEITIQRCLFHILRQGLMWIRSYPKTQAGKDLRVLLSLLTNIKNEQDKNEFFNIYGNWFKQYQTFVRSLPNHSVAFKDLKRTMSLINNALPDMFHFIKDRNIAPTTNTLECFYSQLKHQYRNHRGLTEKHKISFLKWFCYYKNQ